MDDFKITPELIAKIKEINANIVRDVSTVSTRAKFADFIDTRKYYHVRLGQFETVIDGRDCAGCDTALEYATINRTQAWYYDPVTNNDPPRVTTWTHSQFADWLRR